MADVVVKKSRLGSETDHEAAIHYEDCTGAAYRIRKGITKTPLQVRVKINAK